MHALTYVALLRFGTYRCSDWTLECGYSDGTHWCFWVETRQSL